MASAKQLAWLKTMIAPAQSTQRKYGVPASVTLAQWILESGWGQSQLARRCNNYFGIKATARQQSESFTTREIVGGRVVEETARFAKYASAFASFDAHGRLLATRYSSAMNVANDPESFCVALMHGGYSTEPEYAVRLIALIRQFNLKQYDTLPEPDGPAAAQEAA